MSFKRSASLSVALVALVFFHTHAYAQSQWRQMVPQSQPLVVSQTLPCTWQYYWDPPDRFGDVDVALTLSDSGRQFSSGGNGLNGYLEVNVTLDATYLPSTNFTCGSAGVVLDPTYYFDWEHVPLTWVNQSCDGHPPTEYGPPRATSAYWLSEELINTQNQTVFAAIANGGHYWGNVGSDLSYTALETPPGSDVGFYPQDLGPGVPGTYFPGSTRTIALNLVRFPGYSQDQWAWIVAHELGHAIGFGNGSFGSGDTVMQGDSAGMSGIFPAKTWDKYEELGPESIVQVPSSLGELVQMVPAAIVAEVIGSDPLVISDASSPRGNRLGSQAVGTYRIRVKEIVYNKSGKDAPALAVKSEIPITIAMGRSDAKAYAAGQPRLAAGEECLLFIWNRQGSDVWSLAPWQMQFRKVGGTVNGAEAVVPAREMSWVADRLAVRREAGRFQFDWDALVNEVRTLATSQARK